MRLTSRQQVNESVVFNRPVIVLSVSSCHITLQLKQIITKNLPMNALIYIEICMSSGKLNLKSIATYITWNIKSHVPARHKKS